jgi:hypothetical protein
MEPLGLVEIETARIARFEAERIADEQARVQAELDAIPTDEELAAQALKERREVAGVEAYRAHLDKACEKVSDDYTKADEKFRACAADLNAPHDELFSSWSAVRVARSSYVQVLDQRNNANPDQHRVGAGTPIPMLFSEVEEQVLDHRAKNAANVAGTAIAQAAEDARAAAASKIK